MAAEPADVLIIGAGASGGVVARRLAEAGYRVVCLEQGDWHDKEEYRGAELDWELTSAQAVVLEPERPCPARGLPGRRRRLGHVPTHVRGGRRLDAAVRRGLAADAAVRLPGAHRSTGSPTTGHSRYEELRPYYERSDRQIGVSGMGGDPAYPPGEDPPAAAAADRRAAG